MVFQRFAWIGILTGIVYLCATGSGLLWSVTPEWEAGYRERLRKMVAARTWGIGQGASDEDAGKRDWPALLAELWKARGDAARQQELIRNEGAVLLASRWSGSFYRPSTVPGYTLYYSQYKDVLPRGPTGAHPQHDVGRRVELSDARGPPHGPGLPAHGIQ